VETLSREQAAWAVAVGLSIPRAAWLLRCPKHTRGALAKAKPFKRAKGANCYLARINGSLYFRVNRRDHNIIERCPDGDLSLARAYRDKRLAELGLVE